MSQLLYLWTCLLLADSSTSWKVAAQDGKPSLGTIQQFDSQQLVLQTAEGPITIPTSKLMGMLPNAEAVLTPRDKQPAAWIEFTDRTRLAVLDYQCQKGKVSITLLDGKQLQPELKTIQSVRFAEAFDPTFKLGREGAAGDQLGIKKTATVDYLDGFIGDVLADKVLFKMDGEDLPVNRTKVDSLVYLQRGEAELPEPLAMIEDVYAGLYAVQSLQVTGDNVNIKTVSQVELTLPLSTIRKWDFSAGKLLYLSDLKPESMTQTPLIELPKKLTQLQQYYAPRFNQGRDDPLLRLDGQTFNKGIAMHSRTELVYKIPAKSRRLQAVAGIDDSVGNEGNVVVKITGDGKELFSGTFRGADKPVKLDLDLTGVRKLTILVDYGDDLDVGDYFDLADAQILK